MENSEIRDRLVAENEEFRKLGEEHQSLKKLLSQFNEKRYLTPDEELEKKRIQKLKLMKKDRMAEILREYKTAN